MASPAGLARWSAAAGLPEPLPSPLLRTPAITVLARHRAGQQDAGAAANRWRNAVGLSNVVGDDPWTDLLAMHADRDVVGYEHGLDLAAATAAGSTELGRLRIRVR